MMLSKTIEKMIADTKSIRKRMISEAAAAFEMHDYKNEVKFLELAEKCNDVIKQLNHFRKLAEGK